MKQFNINEELIYSLIIEDLEGAITQENKLLLQQWRDETEDNEKVYQDFLNVQSNIDKLYHENHCNADLSWELLDKKISVDKKSNPQINFRLWYKVAAVLFCILSIGGYFIWQNNYITISTEKDMALTHVVLPDGTSVNLNSETTIRYNKANFLTNRKLELLAGEVFIEVVKHNAYQFSVDMGGVVAEDIGTSFNVLKNDQKVAVVVEEGKVALKSTQANEQVLLTPGKLGVYDAKTKSLISTNNTDLNYKAWLNKDFFFQEMPLNQVVNELGKVYQVPIEIKSDKLKERKLTARLHYQTLDSVLAVISESLQCKVTREEKVYALSDN